MKLLSKEEVQKRFKGYQETAEMVLKQKWEQFPALKGRKFRPFIVADVSGSTRKEYSSGRVQAGIDQVAAFWAKANGTESSTPVVAFNNRLYKNIPALTIENMYGFTDKYVKPLVGGWTNGAPPLRYIAEELYPKCFYHEERVVGTREVKKGGFLGLGGRIETENVTKKILCCHKQNPISDPIVICYFGDGMFDDKREVEKIIRAIEPLPIFIIFIGFGANQSALAFFDYLDNAKRNFQDNVNAFHIEDLATNPEKTYQLMTQELPDWITDMQSHGLVV